MYTQPNPALRAALDAASFLEQKANPIAPGPGGMPIKSVTGNLMDAMHQETASSPDEGMGDMGDMGGAGGFGEGLQGILNNFRNAAPTLRENAENAQMDQIANKVAAKMGGQPQMLAHGGIAHGVDDMDFAEGGILGFAVGDKVPDAGELFDTAKAEAAAAREALYKYGSVQKQRDPEGFVAAQQRYEQAQAAKEQAEQAWRKQAAAMGLGAVQVSPGRVTHPQEVVRNYSEYTDPNRARLDVPVAAPAPAAPSRAPAGIAAAPAGGGGGGAGAGGMGGLSGLDKFLATAMQRALEKSPAMTDYEAGQSEWEKSLREQPVPGMTALEALRKSARDREALYKQAEEEQPMRQLRALLSGIHRGGLGGGMEATQATQEAYMREKAARIAEAQLEALKQANIEDMQAAFRTGNLQKIMEAKAKKAELDKNERQILGTLAGHAMSTMGHLQAARETAAASRENAGLRALMAMASKEPKMSFSDLSKLDDKIQAKFFTPTAVQDKDFRKFIRRVPGGERVLQDISNGVIKYNPKNPDKPWGAATPVVERASDMYRSNVTQSVGTISQSREAIPFEDASRDLGG